MEPITIIISRSIPEQNKGLFYNLRNKLTDTLEQFKGVMQVKHIEPSNVNNNKYITLVQFNNIQNVLNWEKSNQRKFLVDEMNKIVSEPIIKERISGIEELSSSDNRVSKWQTVSILIIWILIMGSLLNPMIINVMPENTPETFIKIITTSLTVIIISYWLLPFTSKLLAKFC